MANNGVIIKTEIEYCFKPIENYIQVYETTMLLNSFSEELKLFINRLYVTPKRKNLKTLFVKNLYDTETKLSEDIKVIIHNYKLITEALSSHPEWLNKFKNEVLKQFAFSNIQHDFPEIYNYVHQQEIFK